MTSEEIIKAELTPLIKKIRNIVFMPEYRKGATDEDVLGIIVSKFCEWDINAICEVSKSAFEDSNYPKGMNEMDKLML